MSIFKGRTYRCEGNRIWAEHVETKEPDGSRTIHLGFALCDVNDNLTETEKVTAELTALINAAAADDKRPAGWTEARALQFIAAHAMFSEPDQFAKLFVEGAWHEIAKDWPEFQEFISKECGS